MNEEELTDEKEDKNIIPFFWQDKWKDKDPSVFIKSWVILVLLLPCTALAVVCLYYGIDFAITGSLAAILAVPLIPIGSGFSLAVTLWLIPGWFIVRKIEKKN